MSQSAMKLQAVVCTAFIASMTHAQYGECKPQWVPTFGVEPGVSGKIHAMEIFDDGSGGGPALYIAGDFTHAGGVVAKNIAKWDGTYWSTLGEGLSSAVYSLAVYDDGSGAALYAAGDFQNAGGVAASRIAKWDGVAWSPLGLGTSGTILSLAVYDDGSGDAPALYAGGSFIMAGGQPISFIAQWSGSQWSGLGSGISSPYTSKVSALGVFDGSLYVGGTFETAGAVEANHIARWNGKTWAALGTGLSGMVKPRVLALTAFDDGSGPALYVGGRFDTADTLVANNVAKWDGGKWATLQDGIQLKSGPSSAVFALKAVDIGNGPSLYVGGAFVSAGGLPANCVAEWNGKFWVPLGSGMTEGPYETIVRSLIVFKDESTPSRMLLYAGGEFSRADGIRVNNFARWDKDMWSAVGLGLSGPVWAMQVFDDGSGPALHAGGLFETAGGGHGRRIAKWHGPGNGWSPLAGGTVPNNTIGALEVFDDGSGPALYAAGTIDTIGGIVVNHIAKWDGTSWHSLGSGLQLNPVTDGVHALIVFDDGSGGGPALFVGGDFAGAGGIDAPNIARWNGSSWSSVGEGFNGPVYALCVYDDGSGPALYAGGDFTMAGKVSVNRIARWDAIASAWSEVGGGITGKCDINSICPGEGSCYDPHDNPGCDEESCCKTVCSIDPFCCQIAWDMYCVDLAFHYCGGVAGHGWILCAVQALAVFETADGPTLVAAGIFTEAGGAAADNIASWDGDSWLPMGDGLDVLLQGVKALAVLETDSEAVLFAGGDFNSASDLGAKCVAKFDGSTWSAIDDGFIWYTIVHSLLVWDRDGNGPDLFVGGHFSNSPAGDGHIACWNECLMSSQVPGDIVPPPNGNGIVDVDDLLAVINAWGPCSNPDNCPADIAPPPNGNDIVDVDDLLIVINNWG